VRNMAKSRDQAAALDHVLYEIEMLTYSLLALSKGKLDGLSQNVWIEIFAIHARNLNEFFGAKKDAGAYMRPSHFVTWEYDYSEDKRLARRASAHVSHLTYDREVPGKKTPWAATEIFFPLQNQSLRFLGLISKNEPYMAFQHNQKRTASLIELLGSIRPRE